ncbi:MAG: copper chaperone PCu(A)C [Pseudomonadota bacterium]
MKHTLAIAAALLIGAAAHAQDVAVDDAYARSATERSVTGAAFMTLVNTTDRADRLIAAQTDAAKRVELHTHLEDGDGVMRMIEVEDGFAIPANGTHMLKRGGDHIMLMGLNRPLLQDEVIAITLTFEQAGEVTIEVPVDNLRKPKHGVGHGS